MDSKLSAKTVIVTGASGGIGGDVVRAFVGEGARVIVHYAKQADRAAALVEELGESCLAIGADLTREDDVEKLFSETEQAFGPTEIFVANAGVWPPDEAPLHEMTLEQWNNTLAVNLTSVFLCMRRFFRGIQEHGLYDPSAILIGSTAAIFGEAGHADYAASKAGLAYGLARTLKNEIARLAPQGRINVVCPGWVFTPMTERFAQDKPCVKRVLQTVPLRKVGTPADIARTIVYLASSHLSGHVSGQIITVAGGMEGRVLYEAGEIEL